MINVTQTFLPPLEEYIGQLKKIWECGQVTNHGPLVKELEQKLKNYLEVEHLFFTANGTMALQIAIRALGIKKKVITTPFSYVATTGAILWEYCEPVFVDINPHDFCIDAAKIEAAITPETTAILAVHVYGNSCDVQAIEVVAKKYGLKVLYDAAHAFGTSLDDKPVAAFGDVSALSFHATKLFHTVEGGAIATNDDEVARKVRLYRSFGHIKDDYFTLGINAKNSELHAAMGLCVLPYIQQFIELRREVCQVYDDLLQGLALGHPVVQSGVKSNYAYYPVVFPSEATLLNAMDLLAKENIFPRRYFYPALNRLPYRQGESCPVAEDISARILCLPLYHQLTMEIQTTIVDAIALALSDER
jgi:dTDP-4-amino-4,6-dideoxygalactose transaminase